MGKNTLRLQLKGFEEMLSKLDKLGGDIKKATEEALEKAGKTIGEDTKAAVQKPNLPAKGKYSEGDTEKSIAQNPKAEWEGTTASIGVGFDYGEKGSGGLLITGTPRMKPVRKLQEIYKGKKYMSGIEKEMREAIQKEIEKRMGG